MALSFCYSYFQSLLKKTAIEILNNNVHKIIFLDDPTNKIYDEYDLTYDEIDYYGYFIRNGVFFIICTELYECRNLNEDLFKTTTLKRLTEVFDECEIKIVYSDYDRIYHINVQGCYFNFTNVKLKLILNYKPEEFIILLIFSNKCLKYEYIISLDIY